MSKALEFSDSLVAEDGFATEASSDLHAELLAPAYVPAASVEIETPAASKKPRDESSRYQALKRCVDIAGALVGLVVLGPIMLAAMVAVWIEDGGPVLFRQQRVGLDGKRFTMIKIRSMVRNAEDRLAEVKELNVHDDERTFKALDDPRILRTGAMLRRFSIDEFPQVVNVLKGEMSLVGPRPPLVHEVEMYAPEDHVRFDVKPGLTCFWQIAGRGEIAFEGQLELDKRYIEKQSMLTDLNIIAKTIPAMIRGDGAR